MACNIEKFNMTEAQIKRWCEDGCSVDCSKLLAHKYALKNELLEVKNLFSFWDLRAVCIKYGFYTRGSNEEYEAMFDKMREGATLEILAKDIYEHSNNIAYNSVALALITEHDKIEATD